MSQNNLRCNLGPTQKHRQPQDNLLDILEPLTAAKCHPFDSPLHFFLGICLLKQNPTTFLPSITIQQVSEPNFKPSLESATFRKGNSGERDHCVPILPILEDRNMGQKWEGPINQEDEEASLLLLNPVKYISSSSNNSYRTNKNNGFLFKDEVDEYLNLSEYNSSYPKDNYFSDPLSKHAEYDGPSEGDNIVPFQYGESKEASLKHNHPQDIFKLGSDYQTPKAAKGYSSSLCPNLGLDYKPPNATNSYAPPLHHNVCVSSTDVGIVPEIAASDISTQHSRPPKGTIDRFYGPPIHLPRQLNPIERMARVLRYWEKKKTRNFEKTIRYASRKAYAETRPRIKGRFAKRADVEMEVNQMLSTKIMMDTGYGIVPSFYFPTSIWQ